MKSEEEIRKKIIQMFGNSDKNKLMFDNPPIFGAILALEWVLGENQG